MYYSSSNCSPLSLYLLSSSLLSCCRCLLRRCLCHHCHCSCSHRLWRHCRHYNRCGFICFGCFCCCCLWRCCLVWCGRIEGAPRGPKTSQMHLCNLISHVHCDSNSTLQYNDIQIKLKMLYNFQYIDIEWTVAPVLFAKSAIIWNPLIYICMNKQVIYQWNMSDWIYNYHIYLPSSGTPWYIFVWTNR